MRTRKALTTLLLVAVAAGSVWAAEPLKVSLNAQDMKIEQVAEDLSKQAGMQIICDTGINGVVSGSFSDMDLEALLDLVTKSNSLRWQKIYLPAQSDKKPTLEQIKTQANALTAASLDMPIAVYDPVTKKQTVFVRQTQDAPVISAEKLGLKPIYLISNPQSAKKEDKTAAGDDPMSQYQRLQEERNKALMAMTPEQRQSALQQEMMSQMGMDPDQRAQMMKDQFMARQNMDPAMRDQYRQMMRDTFRQLHDQGVIQHGDHGPRGNGENHQDHQNRNGGQ